MRYYHHMHLVTIIVATSYLTLGVFDTDSARDLWAPYAIVTLLLATANLVLERGLFRRAAAIPDPDRREDLLTREALDGYERFRKVVPRILGVLVAVNLVLGVLVLNLGDENGERIDDIQAADRRDDLADERAATEARERRDQTCTLYERDYRRAVRSLGETYEFLVNSSREQIAEEPILAFVLANLKRTREEATGRRPPRFCDAPGVGLPPVKVDGRLFQQPPIPREPKLTHLK